MSKIACRVSCLIGTFAKWQGTLMGSLLAYLVKLKGKDLAKTWQPTIHKSDQLGNRRVV